MTRSRHGWTRAEAAAGALLLASGMAWGQTFVYPQRGQSPQQQAQDQAVPGVGHTADRYQPGHALGDAGAGGAAIGGDAGKGAAIGAATGAMMGGMCRRDQMQQQQVQQAQAMQMDTFKRAQATCFGARGYTVN